MDDTTDLPCVLELVRDAKTCDHLCIHRGVGDGLPEHNQALKKPRRGSRFS